MPYDMPVAFIDAVLADKEDGDDGKSVSSLEEIYMTAKPISVAEGNVMYLDRLIILQFLHNLISFRWVLCVLIVF